MGTKSPKCNAVNPEAVKFCGEYRTPLEADVVHIRTLETSPEGLTVDSRSAMHDQVIMER